MFYELIGDVYRWVRKSGNVKQDVLAAAVRRERHTIGRWEQGKTMPTAEQERILFDLAKCPRLRFAEFLCKKLSRYIGRSVVILPQGEIRRMPTTPLAEAHALLTDYHGQIPPELRDRLSMRLTRLQTLEQVVEQEVFEMVREVRAYLKAMKVLKKEDEPR